MRFHVSLPLEHELLTSAQVSHVWESREHADPHGYQLRKLAEVVDMNSWYFYDYMSLYQYKRNMASQERSFRRAMANMHVLYAHEHTSTLRIETLTSVGGNAHGCHCTGVPCAEPRSEARSCCRFGCQPHCLQRQRLVYRGAVLVLD